MKRLTKFVASLGIATMATASAATARGDVALGLAKLTHALRIGPGRKVF